MPDNNDQSFIDNFDFWKITRQAVTQGGLYPIIFVSLLGALFFIGVAAGILQIAMSDARLYVAALILLATLFLFVAIYMTRVIYNIAASHKPILQENTVLKERVTQLELRLNENQQNSKNLTDLYETKLKNVTMSQMSLIRDYFDEFSDRLTQARIFKQNIELMSSDLKSINIWVDGKNIFMALPVGRKHGAIISLRYQIGDETNRTAPYISDLGVATVTGLENETSIALVSSAHTNDALEYWDMIYNQCRIQGSQKTNLVLKPLNEPTLLESSPETLDAIQAFVKTVKANVQSRINTNEVTEQVVEENLYVK